MILQRDVHLPNFLGYLALTFFWIGICISIIWFLFNSLNAQNGKGSELNGLDPADRVSGESRFEKDSEKEVLII